MIIWALFSVENEYDQPDYNLVTWRTEKPSFESLAVILDIHYDRNKGNFDIARILQGHEVTIGIYCYRLEKVKEGVVLKERAVNK